jgi:hypothetical protein
MRRRVVLRDPLPYLEDQRALSRVLGEELEGGRDAVRVDASGQRDDGCGLIVPGGALDVVAVEVEMLWPLKLSSR